MNNPAKPLYGHVPSQILPPALPSGDGEAEPVVVKKTGWPKGKPRGPRTKPPPPVMVPPPRAPAAGECAGCRKAVGALDVELVSELVRIARDRLIEAGDDVRTDILYLAARVDGYCSIGCWKHHGATEEQTQKLGGA